MSSSHNSKDSLLFKKTTYAITENFPKNGEKLYKLKNIIGEIDAGCAFFYDKEMKIYDDDTRVLIAFSLDSAVIECNWITGGNWFADIELKNGTIRIERLSEC